MARHDFKGKVYDFRIAGISTPTWFDTAPKGSFRDRVWTALHDLHIIVCRQES